MVAFILLTLLGFVYIIGYHLFGDADWVLYGGIALVLIGSVCALISEFRLRKEIKVLYEYCFELDEKINETLKNSLKKITKENEK